MSSNKKVVGGRLCSKATFYGSLHDATECVKHEENEFLNGARETSESEQEPRKNSAR